jgi:misacylated tRNA(Ala) deacylase
MAATEPVYRTDPYAREVEATVIGHIDGGIILDRTVFYPAGGGQPGDTGTLSGGHEGSAHYQIVEAIHGPEPGTIVHRLENGVAPPPLGTIVSCRLDWGRRYRHMRVHTTLHLLCSIIDGWVTGGQIGSERGRLDFDLDEAPDKTALTERLNSLISTNFPVAEEWIDQSELDANPDMVRTLSVKPPRTNEGSIRLVRIGGEAEPVDRQPCGGTHVRSTAEIGSVVVTKIEKKGRRNRRIVVTLNAD